MHGFALVRFVSHSDEQLREAVAHIRLDFQKTIGQAAHAGGIHFGRPRNRAQEGRRLDKVIVRCPVHQYLQRLGEQLHAGMRDLAVGLAYVVDNTLLSDAALDLSKTLYVAVVDITDRPGE